MQLEHKGIFIRVNFVLNAKGAFCFGPSMFNMYIFNNNGNICSLPKHVNSLYMHFAMFYYNLRTLFHEGNKTTFWHFRCFVSSIKYLTSMSTQKGTVCKMHYVSLLKSERNSPDDSSKWSVKPLIYYRASKKNVVFFFFFLFLTIKSFMLFHFHLVEWKRNLGWKLFLEKGNM